MKRLQTTALCLVSLVALRGEQGGCDSSIVGDPTFDLWCGDKLCGWTLERGAVRRVATWHRSDYGVALVGDPVVLSQQVSLATHDSGCLEVRLQADHDDGVALRFEVDFFADGAAEHSQPIDSDGYRQVTFRLRPPEWFAGVRFAVHKTGLGRAVLAEVKVKSLAAAECEGATPLELSGPRPAGAPCEGAAQCKSGHCVAVRQWRADVDWDEARVTGGEAQVCGGCGEPGDCAGGETCGLAVDLPGYLYLHRDCVPASSAVLGQRCAADAECATSVCCEGVCSECCAGADQLACPAGAACEPLDGRLLGEEYELQLMPAQCSPRQGRGQAGAPCLDGGDCASGDCAGDRQLGTCFLDGRRCADDADCPHWPHACLELGKAGGRCG